MKKMLNVLLYFSFLWPLYLSCLFDLDFYKKNNLLISKCVCLFEYTAFEVSGKAEIPLTGFKAPVVWQMLLELTVLSRSANVV